MYLGINMCKKLSLILNDAYSNLVPGGHLYKDPEASRRHHRGLAALSLRIILRLMA